MNWLIDWLIPSLLITRRIDWSKKVTNAWIMSYINLKRRKFNKYSYWITIPQPSHLFEYNAHIVMIVHTWKQYWFYYHSINRMPSVAFFYFLTLHSYVLYSKVPLLRPPSEPTTSGLNVEQVFIKRPIYTEIRRLDRTQMVLTADLSLYQVVLIAVLYLSFGFLFLRFPKRQKLPHKWYSL